MKEVVFIINGHSTNKVGTSGGAEHCLRLIDYLYKKKYDVCICCPGKYPGLDCIKANSFLTYPPIPMEDKFYSFFPALFFVYWYRIFATIIKLHNVKSDFIITSSHLFYAIVPTFFIGKNHIFVTYIHHIISEQKRKGVSFLVIKFLEKISFYIIKKRKFIVFVDSKRIKESLINKYNFNKNNIYVTRNGIDLNFINNVKGIEKPIHDICFCGRLNKAKGLFDLIKIVDKIKKYYPTILCAIIGEGREKNNLKKEIKNNNLEKNINLLGFLGEKEKIETLRASKLFILPSHEEGWGIVIGEAMACGLPVVVYKLKDIVGIWEDNVTWIECFDLNEFSDTVIGLLKNDKERKLFAQKGLKFAKTLDWNDILENEVSIIMKNKK